MTDTDFFICDDLPPGYTYQLWHGTRFIVHDPRAGDGNELVQL